MADVKRLIVIGAGPAGMMAAVKAAEERESRGQEKFPRFEIILLEKMMRHGRKLAITGKGRGNVTNIAPLPEIVANIPGNGAFLHSSLRAFTNDDVREFFEEAGVPLKVERGGRVFPKSDAAKDIVDAFSNRLNQLGVVIRTEAAAAKILTVEEKGESAEDSSCQERRKHVSGVKLRSGETLSAKAVIIATGGLSYPATGSSGDGLKWAKALGHTIVPTFPALVPLETEETWPKEASGLSLKNVEATLFIDDKAVAKEFGEMLFTHFGVSGPIVLSLSRKASQALNSEKKGALVELAINLKPALTKEQVAARLTRDLEKFSKKNINNALNELLPNKLIAPILDLAYVDPYAAAHSLTRENRQALVRLITALPLTITATRPYTEAIITAGGVATKEIEPKTMASRLVGGLYFAGEVIDIDGFTGGYNLQAAFSTGRAAGTFAARFLAP